MENILDKKAVIVVASGLGRGLAANRAAVLATGLAFHVPEIRGEDLVTNDGVSLLGFTKMPIPILDGGTEASLAALADKGNKLHCITLVFLTRAQGMRSYEEYRESVGQTNYADLDIDAVAFYGDKQLITSMTGNLPMLR